MLRAPFPWFGGKRRAAALIWRALGDPPNYVEPFFGSGAALLARPPQVPGRARTETVNDLDAYLSNFWRAVRWHPEEVASWADWPVSELDLHARHRWLVARKEVRRLMRSDPFWCDPQVAGWWVWGLSQWIGSGWCAQPAWEEQAAAGDVKTCGVGTAENEKRPSLGRAGRGIAEAGRRRERDLDGADQWNKRPALSQHGGRGVTSITFDEVGGHTPRLKEQIPMLSGEGSSGRGTHSPRLFEAGHEKMPKANRGTASRLQTEGLYLWMEEIAVRLRRVRICCGDFERVLGPSVTTGIGLTGVLLDPPYAAEAGRDASLYAEEDRTASARARAWALEHGDDPKLRIVLCGYEGEHDMPESWRKVPWKAGGGYAAAAGNGENAERERLWLSPHCLHLEAAPQQLGMELGA